VKGLVRTLKEDMQKRGAHFLKSAKEETSHIIKKKQVAKRYSLPREHRGRDKLECK
jgi:hypothetical protein